MATGTEAPSAVRKLMPRWKWCVTPGTQGRRARASIHRVIRPRQGPPASQNQPASQNPRAGPRVWNVNCGPMNPLVSAHLHRPGRLAKIAAGKPRRSNRPQNTLRCTSKAPTRPLSTRRSVVPMSAQDPGRAITHWKVKVRHDVAGRDRRYRLVRTRHAISAVLLIAALGLAACGGDDDSTWGEQHQPTADSSGKPDDDGSNDEDSSGS